MEDEVEVYCQKCDITFYVRCDKMLISELDEAGEYDLYPEFCPFCGSDSIEIE